MKHFSAENAPSVGRDLAMSALEVFVVGPRLLITEEGKLFKKAWLQLKQQAARKETEAGGGEGGVRC